MKSSARRLIYLLRHAKTETGGPQMQDYDRALTARGTQNASDMGRYIAQKPYEIEQIVCSGAMRTRQTEALLNEQQTSPIPVRYSDRLYLAGAEDLLHELQQLDDGLHQVMLIGHNPGLHQLGLMLAGSGKVDALDTGLATCTLVVLACNGHWHELEPECCELVEYVNRHGLD